MTALMRAERSPMMPPEERRRPSSADEAMNGTKPGSISSHARALVLGPLLAVLPISALAETAYANPLAKPTNAVARDHLTTGNRLYRVREFEKAIEEYKAGAVRQDAPVFYYNLGQCYRQLGRYEDAIWHYERFLERGKPTGEVEAAVRDFIAQMKGELDKKAMSQPPVEPAPPTSTASTPTVSASSGQMLPTAPPDADHRGMTFQRKLAIGIGLSGVALAGLGVGLGLRAQSFKDDAAEVCPMNPCARSDEANELLDRGKTNALYSNVAFGVGGAAVLGAAVLWITGSQAERKAMVVVPQGSRTFAGVTASLRF
jgi:tetratricopeptide (TPR) repeat protein